MHVSVLRLCPQGSSGGERFNRVAPSKVCAELDAARPSIGGLARPARRSRRGARPVRVLRRPRCHADIGHRLDHRISTRRPRCSSVNGPGASFHVKRRRQSAVLPRLDRRSGWLGPRGPTTEHRAAGPGQLLPSSRFHVKPTRSSGHTASYQVSESDARLVHHGRVTARCPNAARAQDRGLARHHQILLYRVRRQDPGDPPTGTIEAAAPSDVARTMIAIVRVTLDP
jgi:hypothetical protein